MLNIAPKELHVLIVDDWEVHHTTAKAILSHLSHVRSIHSAYSADEMIKMVSENEDINCLIIDFDLGKDSLNGIQAYSILQDIGYDIPAIMVTGNDIDAYQSYTVGIVDVVSKKFLYDFKRLKQAFERLQQHSLYKEFLDSGSPFIPVYDGHTHYQFLASEVLYIQSHSPGCYIHTTRQADPIFSEASLKSYEEFLQNSRFEKLSRFHLVNTAHIQRFNGKDEITLTGGRVIQISSENKKYVMKMITPKKRKLGILSMLPGRAAK